MYYLICYIAESVSDVSTKHMHDLSDDLCLNRNSVLQHFDAVWHEKELRHTFILILILILLHNGLSRETGKIIKS